jgi:PAS domain S-box-containing protein
MASTLKNWQQARQAGSLYQNEIRVRRHDGQYRWFLVRAWPLLDAEGAVVRWFGTNTDIHDMKEAEQTLRENEAKYRLLFDRNPDGVFAVDPAGRFILANAACQTICGYSADELQQKTFMELCAPDRLDRTLESFRRGLTEHAYAPLETALIRKDGRRVEVWVAGEPITADGRVVAIYCTAKDITERKQAERQLKELNETLEQRVAERTAEANRRTEQLRALAAQLTNAEQAERLRLATILHDHLQQLLVGTKFHVGILRSQLKDPGQRETLQQVDTLLDESLDTSRGLTVDLCPPILQQGSMAQVLRWLGQWFAAKHGLGVDVQADEAAHPQAPEVRVLLFQTVRELLFNVVKHAKVSQACVQLGLTDEDRIQVVVSDEGAGFALSEPTRQPAEGGGFGLLNIRERLDWLGGTLAIESAPGAGTRITVTAPMRLGTSPSDVAATMEVRAPADKTPIPAGAGPSGKVRLMLADDHAVVRDGLARVLGTQPWIEVVCEAADGRQAVDMARQLRPEVIVMDVNMPEVDGVEATRQILAEQPDIKVIGLSMFSEEGVAQRMLAAGAAGYLAKTSGPDALIRSIRRSAASKAPTAPGA